MSIVPHTRNPNLIRGRMTDAERAEIERLAATMTNPTSGKIARKINRHKATVNWYMLTHGLIDRAPKRAPRAYDRNGITVHPYAVEHDVLLLELRSQSLSLVAVAKALTSKFGIFRNGHSVRVRLALLAAAPDEQFAPPPRQSQLSATQQE